MLPFWFTRRWLGGLGWHQGHPPPNCSQSKTEHRQALQQAHYSGTWHLPNRQLVQELCLLGWNFLRTVLHFETLLTQSFLLLPTFHSSLKLSLFTHAPYLYPSPEFHIHTQKKYLGCLLLSWHPLLRRPKPTDTSKQFSKRTLPPAVYASSSCSASTQHCYFVSFLF